MRCVIRGQAARTRSRQLAPADVKGEDGGKRLGMQQYSGGSLQMPLKLLSVRVFLWMTQETKFSNYQTFFI